MLWGCWKVPFNASRTPWATFMGVVGVVVSVGCAWAERRMHRACGGSVMAVVYVHGDGNLHGAETTYMIDVNVFCELRMSVRFS